MYLSNNIIRFDDNSKLKESEAFGIDGVLVDVSLLKSRTSQVGRSVTLVLDFANGFDSDLSLFLMLKNANRLKGAGAYLYFEDRPDIKFSQKQFKDKLYQNEELQKAFMDEAIKELRNIMLAPVDRSFENSENKLDMSSLIAANINSEITSAY